MNLIEQIKNDGKAKGLCMMWQMKLRSDLSVAELAKLYITGIDFCISEDFPTLDFLRDNFKGKCEPYGIYIDDQIQEHNLQEVVLNGSCSAILSYDQYSVARIFARHNTEAAITVADNAFVVIDAFDNSTLYIGVAGDKAKVIVNAYNGSKVECITQGIVINQKNKDKY